MRTEVLSRIIRNLNYRQIDIKYLPPPPPKKKKKKKKKKEEEEEEDYFQGFSPYQAYVLCA